MRNNLTVFIICILNFSWAFAATNTPNSWFAMPEDQSSLNLVDEHVENTMSLEQSLDSIFRANQNAIESQKLGLNTTESNFQAKKPADWVPWRAEMFMTDLSLSVSGLLGVLATKGTATVRAYWRKQFPEPQATGAMISEEESRPEVINISGADSDAEISRQIENVIRAAVSSGKIKDNKDLSVELKKAAFDFRDITRALETIDSKSPWFVGRYRLDVSAEGSGHVNPATTVGGEVRFRFEWFRLKRKITYSQFIKASKLPTNLKESALRTFVQNMAYDLDVAFGNLRKFEFQPYQIRMGIGVSAKGTIGVAKGGGGIVGQMYFNRDVTRPTRYPKPTEATFAELSDTVEIIERNSSPKHLEYARKIGLPFEITQPQSDDVNLTGSIGEIIYKVSRRNFQKGLAKSAKISEFFAKRAANQKMGKDGAWRIYELRTAFDASIGGDLPLASINGSVTAQVSFFNQKF